MNRRLRRIFAGVLSGGGGAAVPTYAEILRDTYGASEIYPLTDIPSGTTIHAFVSGAHDGALTGWTLQNTAGPVTGTLAPTSDGTGDVGNIGAISLIFNGGIGSVVIYGKVSDVADWSDGNTTYLLNYKYDNSNWIYIIKHGTLGIRVVVTAGGVGKLLTPGILGTGWFCIGLSWKNGANGDEMKVYANGAQVGTTQTGFAAWTGIPANCVIGSASVSPAQNFKGSFAYLAQKFSSVWSATDMANIYADRLTGGPDINP